MKLDILKNSRMGVSVAKHSPEIFLGVGIGLVLCGTALAIKAAFESDDIVEKAKADLEIIHSAPSMDEQTIRKGVFHVYRDAAFALGRKFGPAFGMELLGIACIGKSYFIIDNRYLGAMAVGETYRNLFSNYRGRVKEELGEDMDRHFRFGTEEKKDIEVTSYDNEGNEKTKKVKKAEVINGLDYSEYARFFDESCPEFRKSPEHNLFFLKAKQSYANDLLVARKGRAVFLNEIYDMLGLPRTTEGQRMGWYYDPDDENSFIDFGIYNITRERARDFVNMYESVILLDFNVMGDVSKYA